MGNKTNAHHRRFRRRRVRQSAMSTAAVVGCGDVSIVHFEAIKGLVGVELEGVCDVQTPAAAAKAHERWGVPAFNDHRALLAA